MIHGTLGLRPSYAETDQEKDEHCKKYYIEDQENHSTCDNINWLQSAFQRSFIGHWCLGLFYISPYFSSTLSTNIRINWKEKYENPHNETYIWLIDSSFGSQCCYTWNITNQDHFTWMISTNIYDLRFPKKKTSNVIATLDRNMLCDIIDVTLLLYDPQNKLSNLLYKSHLSRQWTCWSLRCSWSIACWRCSNYIFIIDLIAGFNRLGKDNCKTRR